VGGGGGGGSRAFLVIGKGQHTLPSKNQNKVEVKEKKEGKEGGNGRAGRIKGQGGYARLWVKRQGTKSSTGESG